MIALILERLQQLSPRARAAVYDLVLFAAVVLAALVWGLPLVGVDALGPVDVTELGSIAIGAAGLAALLARANTPTSPTKGGEHRAEDPA